MGFLWIRNASFETSKINLHCFRFPWTVSSDCMSWLEIWIYWFWNEVFEEKKIVKRFPDHNHWYFDENFDVLFKIRCQACYQIFLDVCFLNLKFRTHKINLFACVLRAKYSPKISFLLLGGIWVAFDTSVSCNCFITYVILSNLWPNFHTHPYDR